MPFIVYALIFCKLGTIASVKTVASAKAKIRRRIFCVILINIKVPFLKRLWHFDKFWVTLYPVMAKYIFVKVGNIVSCVSLWVVSVVKDYSNNNPFWDLYYPIWNNTVVWNGVNSNISVYEL